MNASRRALALPVIGDRRLDLTGLALWLASAAIVVYLALVNGGYGVIERGELGIAVWWLIAVGVAVGALPARRRLPRGALVLLGLLAALTLWTTLSLAWTESSERTAIEIARVAGYLGILALAAIADGGRHRRALLGGLTSGLVAVLCLALLSRLQPNWFPEQVAAQYLPGAQLERRLAYPLNYSSGLAALAAIAIPLLLGAAASARLIAVQAASAAALVLATLVLWLTASSLLIPLVAVGLIAYLLLAPGRVGSAATCLCAFGGGAIAIGAVGQRAALDAGRVDAAALAQGDEMLAIVVVVCAGVALMQGGIGLLARHGRLPARLSAPRRVRAGGLAAALVALLALVLATPLGSEIEQGWEKFRGPSQIEEGEASRLEEVLDPSSQGRYGFWTAGLDAGRSKPLSGIGAGSFEFWWARNRPSDEFARDAHSLFIETFAELGLVGLLLISSFVGAVAVLGVRRALRAPAEGRAALAGASAAVLVFATAAAVDWMWELAVLPAILMLLAAVIASAERVAALERAPAPGLPRTARVAIVAGSLAAIVAIAIPLAGAGALEESRAAAREGHPALALERAGNAAAFGAFAAAPEIQSALVHERRGELAAALAAARTARDREPTNWRTWLIVSRLEARNGDAAAAVAAYRTARDLNPRSEVFAR